jgi:hypothetical protein
MIQQSGGTRQVIDVVTDTFTALLVARIDDIARIFWLLIFPALLEKK